MDEAWADLARASRQALALLGYRIEASCLPGETSPCGGTFAGHAAAHLGVLRAIVDHQAAHLGPDYAIFVDAVHGGALAEFSEHKFCQLAWEDDEPDDIAQSFDCGEHGRTAPHG